MYPAGKGLLTHVVQLSVFTVHKCTSKPGSFTFIKTNTAVTSGCQSSKMVSTLQKLLKETVWKKPDLFLIMQRLSSQGGKNLMMGKVEGNRRGRELTAE